MINDLTDKDQIEIINLTISTLLPLIDKLKHRGVHKVWVLQHLLVARLRWSLLVYEIPSLTVLLFEQNTSLYLKNGFVFIGQILSFAFIL